MKKLLTLLAIVFCSKIHAQIITTSVGTATAGFSGDGGQAIAAQLYHPTATVMDNKGNLYIADRGNRRIRKVNTAGIISTIAGTGNSGYGGNGGPATAASFDVIFDIVIDKKGNIFVLDNYNNQVRKINTNGIISNYAGSINSGYGGDGGYATAATLNNPFTIATDSIGNLYIGDRNNYCIRKVDTTGIITTFAGTGTFGYSGDGGPATAAQLGLVNAVKIDAHGNFYLVDQRFLYIRKIDTNGIITTIAGTGNQGYSNDGGPATAADLDAYSVNVDLQGNIYITDYDDGTIRIIDKNGIINRFAGSITTGYGGDGGPSKLAKLNGPASTYIDHTGNVFIADEVNNRIRKVSVCTAPTININGSNTICFGSITTLTCSGAVTYTWSANAGNDTSRIIHIAPISDTTYLVMGTAASGCNGKDSIVMTVKPLPNVSVMTNTNTICAGGTTTLTAGGANSYTWSTGEITTSIAPSPTITTNYTVTGIDNNNCLNKDTLTVKVISCSTAITELSMLSHQIHIYPNPSSGTFTIETNTSTKHILQVYDVTGKLVLFQIMNGKTTIDANNLSEGIYNLSIISNEGVINKRVVIVK